MITSNKSLVSWGEVIGGDSALMMAILDRLLHHGDVFYLRGASYRLRGKEALVLGTPAPAGAGVPSTSDGTLAQQGKERLRLQNSETGVE